MSEPYVDNGDGTWTGGATDNGDGTWTDAANVDNGDGTWTNSGEVEVTVPSVLTNYGGNAFLVDMFNRPLWLALHTSDPGVTGNPSTELGGGGYARQPITFSVPSGKAAVSTDNQTFTGLPALTVTFLAVWDAAVAGNMWFTVDISATPLTPPTSGQILAAAGDIGIEL